MLQRFFYEALQQGAARFRQTPSLYTQLFGPGTGWGLSTEEVQEITQYFDSYPAQVRHGYGRRAIDDVPTFVVVLGQESQSAMFLGDLAGGSQTAGTDNTGAPVQFWTPATGSIWSHTYEILCLSQPKPQNTLYLYEIGKAIILAAKNNLANVGVRQMTLSGADLRMDTTKAPNTEYMRSITVQCQREFVVSDLSGSLQQAFDVEGVSLPTPSVNPDGNPLTLVSTFDPDNPGD